MIYLVLSVLFTTLLFTIFKLYDKFGVNVLNAIIVNYFVASTVSFILLDPETKVGNAYKEPWIPLAFILGLIFIYIFNVTARSAQLNGVGMTAVANKMSLVVPVLFAVIYYKDNLVAIQVIGILLALVSVYLTSYKKKKDGKTGTYIGLLALVFIGSGVIDTSLNFIKDEFLSPEKFPLFSAVVFGAAGIMGLSFKLVKRQLKRSYWSRKDIIGGICLGVPNYFSIYYLLKALDNEQFNSAVIFTVNNVAIVLTSTLVGILLFREKLEVRNWAGLALAIASIIMVASI